MRQFTQTLLVLFLVRAFKERASQLGLVHPDLPLFCPFCRFFGDSPFFFGHFPELSFSSFSAYKEGPRSIPEGVQDMISSFHENKQETFWFGNPLPPVHLLLMSGKGSWQHYRSCSHKKKSFISKVGGCFLLIINTATLFRVLS